MSKAKKTTEETTEKKSLDETVQVKEAEVVDEKEAENVKDDKPVKEVHNVEDLKPSDDGVPTGTMLENVQHDGVDYPAGTKAPESLVEFFRSKKFCK